jgi:II/X family phage/plasmid replication protein
MIDTIRLASPSLSEESVQRIALSLKIRSQVDAPTGEIEWSFTSGSLAGSWDSRITVQVERDEWVYLPGTGSSKAMANKRPCAPYLVVEGSVHKALMGHNVFGGPVDPQAALPWFVDELAHRLGVTLPPGDSWEVLRADWAEAYELPSFEAVEEFIRGLNSAEFPRRGSVTRYGSESVSSPGRTTTVKAYHKGPEFSSHDRRRLLSAGMPEAIIYGLQDQANRILRLETSIKARKLSKDHQGQKPQVGQLTQDYLERVHDREIARLLKEAQTDMNTVRTHLEVSRRLSRIYSPELADRLLGTWFKLSALGEDHVKKSMSKPTFYRQKKQLIDAGCSWNGTDVILKTHSLIPRGFSPVRRDPRRLIEEAPQVREALESYRSRVSTLS